LTPSARIARGRSRTTWQCWLLTALNCSAFVLIVTTYSGLGLYKAPLSFRYYLATLPTAMTVFRGIADDGSAAAELSQYFQSRGQALTDDDLKTALTMPVLRPQDRNVFIPGDDLGLPRFVDTSFTIFGLSLSAPHKLFFSVLGVSTLIFVIIFFAEPVALTLSLSVLLGIYAFEFLLGLSSQLSTAVDVRFMGALAIVPCLHLCLAVWTARWSLSRAVAAVGQSLLLAAVYQIRSSSGWSLICVTVIAASYVIVTAVDRRGRRSVMAAFVPAALVMGLSFVVTRQQHEHLADSFRASIPTQHFLWHPIHVGFAVHPDMAKEYELTLDDLPAHLHVFRYFTELKDRELLRAAFGGDGTSFQHANLNWRAYEPAVRTVVIRMIRDHPLQAVETFTFYKPLMFARTIEWARGSYTGALGYIATQPIWLMPDAERVRRDAYLKLFRPAALVLLGLAIACGVPAPSSASVTVTVKRGVVVMATMFAASLTAAFVMYPAFQWISDSVVVGCSLLYVLMILTISVCFNGSGRLLARSLGRRSGRPSGGVPTEVPPSSAGGHSRCRTVLCTRKAPMEKPQVQVHVPPSDWIAGAVCVVVAKS
jgi:hypothetical protein